MPRRARPWYRSGRDMWCVYVNGVLTPLGVRGRENEVAAVAAYQQILSHPVGPPPPSNPFEGVRTPEPGPTVQQVCDAYLDRAERRAARGRVSPKCARDYRRALAPFAAAFGPRPAAELATGDGAEAVEDWAAGQGWSVSTRNSYLGVVQSAFKLAGLRTSIRRPTKQSRGAGAVLSDERFAQLLAWLRTPRRGRGAGDLADLLEVLRLTGARPQELAPLTAAGVDWAGGVVRLDRHKTAHVTGEPRVIVLTAAAMAVLARQREKHPAGPLFPTQSGKPYSPGAIVKRLRRASKVLGFRCLAYGCRHSFATAALVGGASAETVAALLGHRSAAMVNAHYSHLSDQTDHLRAAAERASGKRAG